MMEDSSDLAFIYVTFANEVEAARIGGLAVEGRLAACANIFSSHKSIYRWNNAVEMSDETAAIFKTVDGKIDLLAELIVREHSYDTPCIAVITPDQMNTKFADWIRKATRSRAPFPR